MNWEEEIMCGINQMKKYQKTKRIQAKEKEKKQMIETILLAILFFTMYGLIIYFGGKATIRIRG